MKTKLFLILLVLASLVFLHVQGYCDIKPANRFTHPSGNFSIIPPEEFKQGTPRDDGVRFVNPLDGSLLDISFAFASEKFSDSQLIGRFDEGGFRGDFIKGLEQSMGSLSTKVISAKEISVNGISAWEFIAEARTNRGLIESRFIILFKNKKEFLFILKVDKSAFDSKRLKFFEESLSTFQVK
jgi:hypothetical protein